MVDYEIVSWDQSYQMTFYLFEKITDGQFYPDVIVGIARGGWIPARLLADFYGNKRTANIKIEFYDNTNRASDEPVITQEISENVKGKKVLVVDDVADSGKSLRSAVKHIEEMEPSVIKTATLYYKKHSIVKPDFYIKQTKAWIVYPWEYGEFASFKHNQLKEKMTTKEISRTLKDIGIPPHLVDAYFSLIIEQDEGK